jgi:hypothetical protein
MVISEPLNAAPREGLADTFSEKASPTNTKNNHALACKN